MENVNITVQVSLNGMTHDSYNHYRREKSWYDYGGFMNRSHTAHVFENIGIHKDKNGISLENLWIFTQYLNFHNDRKLINNLHRYVIENNKRKADFWNIFPMVHVYRGYI